jgi:hypothetical protein
MTFLSLESVELRVVVLGCRCPGGGRSVRRPSYSSAGPSAGGPADQVVALGDIRGPAGGLGVRRGGGGQVAVELVQAPAHGA